MRKAIRTVLIIVFAGVFVFSAVRYLLLRRQYAESREVYAEAADRYTKPADPAAGPAVQAAAPGGYGSEVSAEPSAEGPAEPVARTAPFEVDFEQLTSVGRNVIGWIYCEGTVINYPVVYGVNNSFYLDHDYTGAPCGSGAIFTDVDTVRGFVDSNVIIYGHHMSDLSMFATLKYWKEQDYMDEHPVMWLLTPEQDYRVELFAAYDAQADSSTYTIFRGPCTQLDEYLRDAVAKSQVSTSVELDPYAKYVLLSTCAYSNALARTVLHGKLVPVDSAGGRPIN